MPSIIRSHDYENMLEDTLHMEYSRRPDMSDGLFPGISVGYPMWESCPIFSSKPKKEEKVGLAEAITGSILSTVLNAIPSSEAIDNVEVTLHSFFMIVIWTVLDLISLCKM
ncbi:hypothetical protein OIU79_004119 [Salix purpurea]|uniref:Uncharacterized protein n=1 Tax=Salix purpurea TaxID=77065 RepID=A0A9Q0U9J0_SALPP|nr:hypothetical protein OIU79_004119 [Salix purpurea]